MPNRHARETDVLKAGSGGRIFGAVFETKSGRRRVFNGRLARHSRMGKVGGKIPYNPSSRGLVTAFDVVKYNRFVKDGESKQDAAKNSYIMINVQGIESLSAHGKTNKFRKKSNAG